MNTKPREIKGQEVRSRDGVTHHQGTRAFQKRVLKRKKAAKAAKAARKRNR